MGSAIGQVLPEAIGVAVSPVTIITVVLLLSSGKSRAKAWAFLVGWLFGLAIVGTAVLLLADPAGATSDDGSRADWVGWLLLALGALLILGAVREWRSRPRAGEEPPMPGWMKAIDTFSAGKSAGMGFLMASVNPKNLALTLAAAAGIATAGLTGGQSATVMGIFVVVATLGLALPIAVYYLGGDRSAETLAEMRDWLAHNNTAIMAVLLLVIGAKLIGNGLQIVT